MDDQIDAIAAGKAADLVSVEGDPSTRIADVQKGENRLQRRLRLRSGKAS